MNSKIEDLVVRWRAEADRLESQEKTLTNDRPSGYKRGVYEAEMRERARTLRWAASELHSELLNQKLQALKSRSKIWEID